MNVILIQGAENSEIEFLESKIIKPEKIEISDFQFIKGKYKDTNIVISRTRVGEINAAIATTIAILNFKPTLIINQGTAGGHGKNVHKGDIVIGTECLKIDSFYSEFLEEGKGYSIDNWKFKEYNSDEDNNKMKLWKKTDENLVKNIEKALLKVTDKKIWKGVIASGDVWNRECDRILYLNEEYKTLCEEMEMAGVYKTANHFGIPAISIRIISNNEVNKEKYEPTIAEELQKIIYNMIPFMKL